MIDVKSNLIWAFFICVAILSSSQAIAGERYGKQKVVIILIMIIRKLRLVLYVIFKTTSMQSVQKTLN